MLEKRGLSQPTVLKMGVLNFVHYDNMGLRIRIFLKRGLKMHDKPQKQGIKICTHDKKVVLNISRNPRKLRMGS